MGSESFKIDWDNFPSKAANTFRDIYKNDKFSDVTLVSEDLREIKAHRLVITNSSSVLRRILYKLDCPNPVLYLSGISHSHLEAVLEFLYLGSVTVSLGEVQHVLAVAKQLKVDQLCIKTSNTASTDDSDDSKTMSRIDVKRKKTKVVNFNNDEDDDNDYYEAMDFKVKGDNECDEEVNFSNADIKTSYSDYEEDTEDLVESVKEYPCQRCDVKFSSYAELQDHKMTSHPGNKFPCPQCAYVAGCSGDRKKHIENIHERKKHPCPQCDFMASSKGYLRVHMESHDGVKYECYICQAQITNRRNLQRHIKTIHKIESAIDD